MKCPYCGKEVSSENKFCDGCGAKLDNKPAADPNAFNYQNNLQPKKSNTGLIVTIIIISVLVVAGIIIGIVLLTGGKNSNNESNKEYNNETYNTENKEKNEEKVDTNTKNLDSNIVIEETKLDDGNFVVFVENKNKSEVDVSLTIEYLDENGVIVDEDSNFLSALAPGQKSVISFYGTSREYSKYEISVTADKSYFYQSQVDNVKISSKEDKENEEIVVNVSNNSKKEIDCRIAVVFYKNNKIVGYEYDSEYDLEAGKTIAMYIDYPYVGYNETFEYDDYKVIIQEAYSSKY